MAVTVDMSGAGTIGKLDPAWSVTEQATPVAIGDSSGSVGSATLTGRRTDDTDFAGNNDLQITSAAGSWNGRVTAVDLGEISAGLSVEGQAGRLIGPVTAKPVIGGTPILEFPFPVETYGSPHGIAVDSTGNTYVYAQVYAAAPPTTSSITKWSPFGEFLGVIASSGAGLGANGETGVSTHAKSLAIDPTDTYIYFKRDAGVNLMQKITIAGTYVTGFAPSGAGDGQLVAGGPSSTSVASNGNVYVTSDSRVQVLSPTGTFITKWAVAQVTDLALDANDNVYTIEDGAPDVVRVFTSTGTVISSFNLTGAFGSQIAHSITVNPAGTEIYVALTEGGAAPINRIYAYDTAGNVLAYWTGGGARKQNTTNLLSNGLHYRNGKLHYRTFKEGTFRDQGGGGNQVAVVVPQPRLSSALMYYISLIEAGWTLNYTASADPYVALPGWTGNLWAQIKDLCAVHHVELNVNDSTVTVRDIGQVTLTVPKHTPIRVKPITDRGAKQIDIVCQNAVAGTGLTMYTATRIHTIDLLQTRTITEQTTNHPLNVDTMSPTVTVPPPAGQYNVQDALFQTIPASTWTYYGGGIFPSVGDAPGQIKLTFQGPRGLIPGFTGPFSFATGSGVSRVPGMSITGTGVTTSPRVLPLRTGARTESLPRGSSINNFAISTLEQAYDRGSWASSLATGVQVEIRFEMPVADLAGHGLDTGSLIRHADNQFRVTNVQYRNLSAAVTAVRHVIQDDVTTLFSSWSNADMKALWAGFTNGDTKIKPFRTAQASTWLYPSTDLYPSTTLYPGDQSA